MKGPCDPERLDLAGLGKINGRAAILALLSAWAGGLPFRARRATSPRSGKMSQPVAIGYDGVGNIRKGKGLK